MRYSPAQLGPESQDNRSRPIRFSLSEPKIHGGAMKLESLRELFIEELQDLYSAEKMILKALPKMVEKASSAGLRDAFEEHRIQTEGHVQRLDQVFDQLQDMDGEDKTCKGMEGIIKENEDMLK